jgi:cell division protein FtsQ
MPPNARNRRRGDAAQRQADLAASVHGLARAVGRALALVVLVAACVAGGFALRSVALTTPRLGLQRVHFHGLTRATEDELTRLAGLAPGSNLIALDTDQVASAMEGHPWVQRARVRRELPHELYVEVTEHVPVALISLGELYLLNAAGEPFKRASGGDALDLPLVTGVEREEFLADRAAAVARLAPALQVVVGYPTSAASAGAPLSEVHLEGDSLCLCTTRGERVYLPTADVPAALARLARVRAALRARAVAARVIRLDNRVRANWVTVQPAVMAAAQVSMK